MARKTAEEILQEDPIRGVAVTVEGISPGLLMHRFPEVPVESFEKLSPEDQAELAAYREPQTQELVIPSVNMQRSLVAAAAYSKGRGRSTLTREVAACLFVEPAYLSLGTDKIPAIDHRPVVIKATKGRIMRHRPWFPTWRVQFHIEYDSRLLTEEAIRKIVDDAGQRVGVLDFRPACKGPFGRFRVVEWV